VGNYRIIYDLHLENRLITRGCFTVDDFTTTNKLAALGIGREAARLLMKKTPDAVVLPALNGIGQPQTRRMPEDTNVFRHASSVYPTWAS
jgi:hypothetical protein